MGLPVCASLSQEYTYALARDYWFYKEIDSLYESMESLSYQCRLGSPASWATNYYSNPRRLEEPNPSSLGEPAHLARNVTPFSSSTTRGEDGQGVVGLNGAVPAKEENS